MRRIDSFAGIAMLILGFASPLTAQQAGMAWKHDIEAAKAEAAKSDKLVLVHFWTPSCGPCLRLDSTVFNQSVVASSIEQRFVPVKLNADEFQATAQTFGITEVPTDVVITPDGKVVGKMVSPATPTAYVSELTQLANRFQSESGGAFQQAVASAPMPSNLNSAYSGLNIGQPAPTAQAATTPGSPPTQSRSAAGGDRPAQPPSARYAAGASVSQSSPTGASGGATPPKSAGTAVAPKQANPQPNPAQITNQYASASQQAASPSPASEAAVASHANSPVNDHGSTAEPVRPPTQTQLPEGSPPLAFEGFCPVSMKKNWQWVAGDSRWGAVHRGRTYLFASQAAQQEFLANPDFYSPALSGKDPVIAIDQQQQVEGLREHSLEYDGQFYLFSSEDSLRKFESKPEHYASGVRQAMGLPSRSPGQVRR